MSVPNGLVNAARTAAQTAARHAAAADADRRLPGAVVDALVAAGFTRSFVPAEFGGQAVGFGELTEAVATVGEGCASAAWVASLLAQGSRTAGYLPGQGRAQVWAKGADTLLVVGFVAQGAAEAVDGGWRLSGTWSYVSGVEFSDWALVLARPDPADPASARFFAVPREEYGIVETWFSLGVRATGSHSLTLDGVFVPAHCSFAWDELLQGRPTGSESPHHRVPLFAVNGLTFGAPVLGAARGALTTAAAGLRVPGGPPPGESARVDYARSAGEIEAASLLMRRVAEVADEGRFTDELLARGSRDSALAVDLLVGAVDRLFGRTGTRGQAETQPLQRFWRDVHSAGSHGVLRFEPAAMRFTDLLLSAV
jgi:alkylation response protein AidB-like acyl-CoA dehydrogenase